MTTEATADRRAPWAAAALTVALVVLGACSSAHSTAEHTSSRPSCTRPAAAAPSASPVAGAPADRTITSFDGTRIRAHWFPLPTASRAKPVPTVLMGPGWSLPGDTDTRTALPGVLGALSISTLQKAGYNVLTWDPRGFGKSGGKAEVDSADYEGRDVSVLLDWVAAQPTVRLDRAGDPRVGMVGASYGGGIQFITASSDCRVDVIVPTIAWHSLGTSLYKSGISKLGWSSLLIHVPTTKHLDPHIDRANASSEATGTISAADAAWFLARGPADRVARITAPTLIIQGTVDTLFSLDEGVSNYRILRDRGVPVSMLWYCSGHGPCLTDPGDPNRAGRAAMAWLAHYLDGNTKVATGPRFSFVDQNGTEYTADDYPLPTGTPLTAEGKGTLQLVAKGGAGPATVPAGKKDLMIGLAGSIIPGRATNAVDVPIDSGSKAVVILGAPQLQLTYRGTVAPGKRPTRVFAQLVDDRTGLVLGNQITPVPVTLDGKDHTVSVPLEIVAYTAKSGTKLILQIAATTVAYAPPRLGGSIDFSKVSISLPTAKTLTPR